jgi:GH25 family lysozyme M1 (1,4-beta-N-acetylmuramidase)
MTLNVIDIGKDQAGINLAAVPCDAVIVGVCDAFTNNPHADAQYQGARRAGKRVGVYQYFRNDPAEADYFVSQIRGYVGQAMIIIDAETDAPNMVAATLEAARRIEAGTGVKPVIYAPAYLLNKYDWSPAVRAGYMLWLAAYVAGDAVINGFNPPAGLQPPKWWVSCGMWQFTSTGRLPGWGGNLDLSQFYGNGAAWDAYTKPTITTDASSVTPIQEPDMPLTTTDLQAVARAVWGYRNSASNDPCDMHQAVLNAAATTPATVWAYQNPASGDAADMHQYLVDAAKPSVAALTDAQVTALADQLRATLPAATLEAFKAQINK